MTNMLTVLGKSIFFLLAFASKVWLSKTDPYRVSLELSAIFPIVQVGKSRHSTIVLVTDSIMHIPGPVYGKCMKCIVHNDM